MLIMKKKRVQIKKYLTSNKYSTELQEAAVETLATTLHETHKPMNAIQGEVGYELNTLHAHGD